MQPPEGWELPPGVFQALTLSPDGRHVVFSAVKDGINQLHVRSLDQLNTRPIQGTTGATNPFFAPDGRWLGFVDTIEQTIKKVPLAGGTPTTISSAQFNSSFGGASWGPNGTIVFGADGRLMLVPDTGGSPVALTNPRHEAHSRPHFLPDGRSLLFAAQPVGAPIRRSRC